MEFSIISLLLAGIVVLFASSINAITGFGFALLLVPFLNLIFSPKIAVPVEVILANVLNMSLFIQCRKEIELKKVSFLLLGAIVGLPFGAYVLSKFSTEFLKIFISVITITLAILLSLGISKQFKKERLASLATGFISGGLKGSTGMAGPPVILFGLNQNWGKGKLRPVVIGYFTIVSLLTIPVFIKFHLFTMVTVKLAFIGLPMLMLGFIMGIRLKDRVSQTLFRRVAFALIMLAGISGLISGLRSILSSG